MLRKHQARIKKFMKKEEGDDEQFGKKIILNYIVNKTKQMLK